LPGSTRGHAAATIFPARSAATRAPTQIAFDGDAVLFSDRQARLPGTGAGGFARSRPGRAAAAVRQAVQDFLAGLHRIRPISRDRSPIRTALVTARSAPAHERAIRTLMDWNISVDEAMFLGGLDKGAFLREFEPDFYFDDQTRHVDSASRHVPSGHVPHGIANE
jgi:5'-nucleotidase